MEASSTTRHTLLRLHVRMNLRSIRTASHPAMASQHCTDSPVAMSGKGEEAEGQLPLDLRGTKLY